MSFSTAVVSSTVSFISALFYTRYISKNHKQLIGIAIASLLNATRPYTEKHLKKWFQERNLDYIYGASSASIMGPAAHFAKIPLKVNILSTLFFTATQVASYKFAASFFTTITAQQLTQFRKDTFHGGNYLMDQIFSTRVQYQNRDQSCAAYMYVMPGGFMILLAATKGYPAFSYTHTSDGTEVERLRCCPFQTINLSQRAYNRLIALSRQVDVINLDTTRQREQWDLQGIPPCICIEGRWNQTPQPYGTHVDLETLILENAGQRHEAFELRMIEPTWQRIEQTPNLRGLSFNHSVARFNIWVHERNDNVLVKERQELANQVDYLQSCITFIRDFATAEFQFATTPKGKIQRQKLDNWAALAHRIPFSYAAQNYSDLTRLVKEQGISDQVIGRFRQFFQNLPREACFATDYTPAEQFFNYLREFELAGNGLVRNQVYINPDKLKEWLTMLRFVSYRFGSSADLTQLINDSQEYLDINNTLRIRQAPQDPVQRQTLNDRRAALDPILEAGFRVFFQTYREPMQRKGEFVKDLIGKIAAINVKQKRLKVFTLCKQSVGNFVAADYLQTLNGLLDVEKLTALSEMVELLHDGEAQRRTLIQNSQRYVRLHGMLANVQLQEPELSANTGERNRLIPLILDGYNWFLNTHLLALNGRPKQDFFSRLTTYAECPRSYVESTAQIEFYSKLETSGLHLIIRLNRAYQISSLVSSIERIQHLHNDDLSQEFYDKFAPIYDRIANFVVRKAQALEIELIPFQKYNENDGLHTQYEERRCDGSKYRFEACQSRNGQNVLRLLKDAAHKLSILYTNVNQKNYEAYCSSPFLKEEVGLLEELYAITHELFFLFNTPVRWSDHSSLHKDSIMIKKARAALAGGDYLIYKRIEDGGNVVSDVVRRGEVSELERRGDVHAAIYMLYR